MEKTTPSLRLCTECTEAEFDGRLTDARALSLLAWREARTDFEACVAAHYVARYQERLSSQRRWNEEALARAEASDDERVRGLFPSLYVNLGRSLELLGEQAQADHYYTLAASQGLVHTSNTPASPRPIPPSP